MTRISLISLRLLVLLLGALLGRAALAQACCSASNPTEFGVVGPCQHAAIATQIGYQSYSGTYDETGKNHKLTGMSPQDATLLIGGGWRPLRGPVQIQAALPLRWQQRAYPTMASQSAVGVGDAAVALRWTALEDKMTGVLAGEPGMYLPFLDLAAGVKMPTGRATEDGNPDKAGADVTGDGAWQVTATVRVLKYVTRQHAFGIGADYSHQFDRSVPDGNGGKSKFAKGDSLEVRGTWLQLHGMYWSWGAFASYLMGADAHQAGVAVPDSAVRHFRVGASVTRVLSLPAWETTLGVALDPWWQDGARNVPYVGPSVSLSLRRNFL